MGCACRKSFRSVTEPLPYPLAVEYLCDEGYTIDGELMGSNKFYMSCGADGSLVGDVETECQPVSCGVIEVIDATPSTPDPIAFPTEVTYTCKEGFAMEVTSSPYFEVTQQRISHFCSEGVLGSAFRQSREGCSSGIAC